MAADKPPLPPGCIYASDILDHVKQMFPGGVYTISQAVPNEQADAFWSYMETRMISNVIRGHPKGIVSVLEINARADESRKATLFAAVQKTSASPENVSCAINVINPVDRERLMEGFEENSI